MGTVTNVHSTAGPISRVTFVQATVLWWCNQNMPFTPSAASHTYNIGLPSHNCRVLPGLAIEPKRRVFAWAVIETLPYLWLKSDYCSYKIFFYCLLWILWTWMFFFNFYCYSITVVCLFSPSLHPTPAEPTSLPHLHPRPWFCPCVLCSSSCNTLFPLSLPPPPGYCYIVLNFNVSGYILFAFFYCWLCSS